jgi:hypothetical protein
MPIRAIRDKQVGACTAILERSTEMQLALLRQRRHGGKVDWTAWNQALAAALLNDLAGDMSVRRRGRS